MDLNTFLGIAVITILILCVGLVVYIKLTKQKKQKVYCSHCVHYDNSRVYCRGKISIHKSGDFISPAHTVIVDCYPMGDNAYNDCKAFTLKEDKHE